MELVVGKRTQTVVGKSATERHYRRQSYGRTGTPSSVFMLSLFYLLINTSSVVPFATGNEVIKFWKVKGQGRLGGRRSTERIYVPEEV